MKIEITLEEALMLNSIKRMRKVCFSEASKKVKEDAMNSIFWDLMRELDERGID